MEFSLPKSCGIFFCVAGILVTFTMISWIVMVLPDGELSKGNEQTRRKRALSSTQNAMCAKILPPEFYEPFTHTRNMNCNPILPSEYDCQIANMLFKSEEVIHQIDYCRKILSGISFKVISCNGYGNPFTCWRHTQIPNTKTNLHQCRILYQANGTDEIKTLSFSASNGGLTFHKLKNKYKLEYFMLVCSEDANRYGIIFWSKLLSCVISLID